VLARIDEKLYAVVNVNAFEGVDHSSIRRASANFDNEHAAARLARWKRNWIADVKYFDRGTRPIAGPERNDP
jgi:hypothetical protein